MSTIWIINQYASTPATGIGGRHHFFARELAAQGHRVYLIAARWHHLLRDGDASDAAPEVEAIEGFKFVRIPVPRYTDAHDKRRMLNWMLFSWRVATLHRRIVDYPAVILYSSPQMFASLAAQHLANRLGARFVFEVRDIWPLTLVELGGKSLRHPIIRLMQWIEDRTYRNADRVVSNLPGAVEHMVSRGMSREKFCWVPNGISRIEMARSIPLSDQVSQQLPRGKFLVGYAGTLGLANALDNLLSAAEQLRNRNDIAFVLVGGGRERQRLETKAKDRGLKNVYFLNPVSKSMVQSVIAEFDTCFIGWSKSPLYRFGIAANKIFDYFYAGRPILHSFSGFYDPVSAYDAGLTVEADNPTDLAGAILQLHAMPAEERHRMGENGRRAALEHYDYEILGRKLEGVLLDKTTTDMRYSDWANTH